MSFLILTATWQRLVVHPCHFTKERLDKPSRFWGLQSETLALMPMHQVTRSSLTRPITSTNTPQFVKWEAAFRKPGKGLPQTASLSTRNAEWIINTAQPLLGFHPCVQANIPCSLSGSSVVTDGKAATFLILLLISLPADSVEQGARLGFYLIRSWRIDWGIWV